MSISSSVKVEVPLTLLAMPGFSGEEKIPSIGSSPSSSLMPVSLRVTPVFLQTVSLLLKEEACCLAFLRPRYSSSPTSSVYGQMFWEVPWLRSGGVVRDIATKDSGGQCSGGALCVTIVLVSSGRSEPGASVASRRTGCGRGRRLGQEPCMIVHVHVPVSAANPPRATAMFSWLTLRLGTETRRGKCQSTNTD